MSIASACGMTGPFLEGRAFVIAMAAASILTSSTIFINDEDESGAPTKMKPKLRAEDE